MKSWFANRRPHLPYRKQIQLLMVAYLLGSVVLMVLPVLAPGIAVAHTEYGGVRQPDTHGPIERRDPPTA